jgi:hypothetical protein
VDAIAQAQRGTFVGASQALPDTTARRGQATNSIRGQAISSKRQQLEALRSSLDRVIETHIDHRR